MLHMNAYRKIFCCINIIMHQYFVVIFDTLHPQHINRRYDVTNLLAYVWQSCRNSSRLCFKFINEFQIKFVCLFCGPCCFWLFFHFKITTIVDQYSKPPLCSKALHVRCRSLCNFPALVLGP